MMALPPNIVELIRDEIGIDNDFSDSDAQFESGQLGSLESIYLNESRGDQSILRTALVCWLRRQNEYTAHGFDVSTAGTLLNRRQRMAEIRRRVWELRLLIETTNRGKNQRVKRVDENEARAEFS